MHVSLLRRHITNRPPKGDRSEEFDFLAPNPDFWILANNLIFGLSDIVEGTFLKLPFFRKKTFFSFFGADFPTLTSKLLYFELILWVSELISLYFGCLNLYVGCQNLYFGCLNLYRWFWVSELILWASEDQAFWYDPWIWKYWRTKHSGMTRASGNTEGPSILVWLVNLETLKDQAFWYGT